MPLERGYADVKDVWRAELRRVDDVLKTEIELLKKRVRKLEARVKELEESRKRRTSE